MGGQRGGRGRQGSSGPKDLLRCSRADLQWGVAEDFAHDGCDQIAEVPELADGVSHCTAVFVPPSRHSDAQFDAIGFSQGGLFLRWYAQYCKGPKLHNLITVSLKVLSSQLTTVRVTALWHCGAHSVPRPANAVLPTCSSCRQSWNLHPVGSEASHSGAVLP